MRSRRSAFRATMEQYGLVPDRGVISILVVLTAVWLVFRLLGHELAPLYSHLILIPARAIGPEPWQLFTNFFINPKGGQVFMAAVTLLFFGNAVERALGARGVWKTFIVGGIGGSIAAALIGRLILPDAPLDFGSAGATTAMLTAFAASAGKWRVSFFGVGEMRPATMAWIWLGITVVSELLQFIDGAPWQLLVISLFMFAGAAAAGWYAGGGRRRGGIDFGGSLDKLKLWRLRRRYRVLSGGRDSRDTEKYLN